MRPYQSGNSLVLAIAVFMILAAASFTIAAKMGLVSASFTIGIQKDDRQERTPLPVNSKRGGDYQIYSKDAPRK